MPYTCFFSFFFFNDTATTEIYTLSLHDALPICPIDGGMVDEFIQRHHGKKSVRYIVPEMKEILDSTHGVIVYQEQDRKSTRLNSSHLVISYAVFCLKKKKKKQQDTKLTQKQITT